MKKESEVKKERVQRYLGRYFSQTNIDIEGFDNYHIDNFIRGYLSCKNRSSFYQNMKALNEILEENNIQQLDSSKYTQYVDVDCEHRYFTKEEIQDLCSTFLNASDQFLVYALFCGIYGKNYSEIINMKVSQIADDYSYITLSNGTKFECDEFMQEILEDTMNECYYYSYTLDSMRSQDVIEYNTSSEYLIKVMPTKRNNQGLNPITTHSIQRRLIRLSEVTEVVFSGTTLMRSGIIYKMYQMEKDLGVHWSYSKVEKYLKANKIRNSVEQIYKSYYNKYHKSNVGSN